MKTMRKGMLTVAKATVVASAAVMLIGISQTASAQDAEADKVGADTKKSATTYPAPPPGPFIEGSTTAPEGTEDTKKADDKTSDAKLTTPEVPSFPVTGARPDIPKATVADAAVAATADAPKTAKTEETEVKEEAPKTDATATAPEVKPATEAIAPPSAESRVAPMAPSVELSAPAAPVAAKAPKADVQAPEAPTALSAPEAPKTAEAPKDTVEKAPQAPVKAEGNFPKAVELPSNVSTTNKAPTSAPALIPAMPQGVQPMMMAPAHPMNQPQMMPMMMPNGVLMPKGMGMPKGMVIPPQMQMMGGQPRMMVIPVYPMNMMGRTVYGYPYGYQQMQYPRMMPNRPQLQPVPAIPAPTGK
ncbi:MAG: hypothetical protein KAG28_10765 [Cocleimonas sp.]|nr:hypothetical protein [Cocleimonas sp.]